MNIYATIVPIMGSRGPKPIYANDSVEDAKSQMT